MQDFVWTEKQLDGFQAAAQSLKLYRRADIVNEADGTSLIEELYVDPLPNNHVLKTLLRGNTTFLIGRKGTGKSTVFSRAQHELRKSEACITAYIDIKSVYEQSQIDPEILRRLQSHNTLTESSAQHLQLYKAFLKSIIAAVKEELGKRSQAASIVSRIRETIFHTASALAISLDDLIEDANEDQFTSILASKAVAVAEKRSHAEEQSVELKASIKSTGEGSVGGRFGEKASAGEDESRQYAEAFMRTFDLKEFMNRLKVTLNAANITRLFLFIDDFSELPSDAMKLVVDAVLAPLNNWSDELVKFKIAAYPGRVYMGAIDKTKVDEVPLDLYSIYGKSDVSTMEEKGIDFTRRLIEQRLQHYTQLSTEAFLAVDSTRTDIWRLLFFATMGNPRTIGYLLFFLYEMQLLSGARIGARAINEASRRYYEEKIEAYFRINRFLHEAFEERSSIYSLKELLEAIVVRARGLRHHESEVIRRIKGIPPRSHFHVALPYESLLATLELNFFITKYFEMTDRDGQKVAIYALNYGLCQKYNLSFGRPTEAREFRLYFVERIFDFTPILQDYIKQHQEIVCDTCRHKVPLDQLESLKVFRMLCPECRIGACVIINLSRKYESLLVNVDATLLLPSTELGILQTLHDEKKPQFAQTIAAELDCSHQLVGRRGKNLFERGLVNRTANTQGRRTFSLTDAAEHSYFTESYTDELDMGDNDN